MIPRLIHGRSYAYKRVRMVLRSRSVCAQAALMLGMGREWWEKAIKTTQFGALSGS